MALRSVMTTLALASLLAVPAGAEQRDRRRPNDNRGSEETQRARSDSTDGERAVPRAQPRRDAQPAPVAQDQRPEVQARAADAPRSAPQARAEQSRRYDNNRNDNNRYDNNRYDNNRYDNNHYDNRYDGSRRYDNGNWRRYDAHHHYHYYFAAPRVIRPAFVQVVPYRPYVYRPSFSVGVFYGSGGYYPYGYTPQAYFEPMPGRPYGGLRITGAPRDARVFADGYFVGIVNDFDGIFQHLNLEAGPHRIEIDWGGYQPLAFDAYVRPGETTTFRADGYYRY